MKQFMSTCQRNVRVELQLLVRYDPSEPSREAGSFFFFNMDISKLKLYIGYTVERFKDLTPHLRLRSDLYVQYSYCMEVQHSRGQSLPIQYINILRTKIPVWVKCCRCCKQQKHTSGTAHKKMTDWYDT